MSDEKKPRTPGVKAVSKAKAVKAPQPSPAEPTPAEPVAAEAPAGDLGVLSEPPPAKAAKKEGKPKKDKKEKKKARKKEKRKKEAVIIRFEDAHLPQIDAKAEALGLSRAAWVRMVVAQALAKG